MRTLPSALLAPLALALVTADAAAQDRNRPHWKMDYGPVLATTIQGWSDDNVALKGRLVQLDDRSGVVFDTELLRVAAAWTDGFVWLRGTPFDGAHGPVPYVVGDSVARTVQAPGWADAGSYDDPRAIPHGPLPGARFLGHYQAGREVVLRYRVGEREIHEQFHVVERDGVRALARVLEVGPGPACETVLLQRGEAPVGVHANARSVRFDWQRPAATTARGERAVVGWHGLSFGGPAATDWADQSSGRVVTAAWVRRDPAPAAGGDSAAPAVPAGPAGPAVLQDGLESVLFDGQAADGRDDRDRCAFFDGGVGRLVVELGNSVPLTRINAYARHGGNRAKLAVRLFWTDDAALAMTAADLRAAGWSGGVEAETKGAGGDGYHAVTFPLADQPRARRLVLECKPVSGKGKEGSFLTELDVWTADLPAPVDAVPTFRDRSNGVWLAGAPTDDGAKLVADDAYRARLAIPAADETRTITVLMWDGPRADGERVAELASGFEPPNLPSERTSGGAPLWERTLTTAGQLGKKSDASPWAVDTITVPDENPWSSRLRFGAFDFLDEGRAALSTWNGDVWIVSGLDGDLDELVWKRFATGLHDPLGLKVVDGVIHTHGRDQITRLHDLNDDGEADWYECFNNDVLITKGFHEFAFDLQTDVDGNFYFSKGGPVNPGGRGFQKIVPHHGTILRLSKDGSKLEPLVTGLRAPNGIGVSPAGILTCGENEGTWVPACRLVYARPDQQFFAGVQDTAHRVPAPETYDDPLCWMPMSVDNSSGGQVWVENERWGPFAGRLLHQSYGKSSLYLVSVQEEGERVQGGVIRLPLQFASAQMRARFHPDDGQLYVCGFKGWQTNAARPTAFQRVRWVGGKVALATDVRVTTKGVFLTFGVELDSETANDPESYELERWNYKYSKAYGSPEYSLENPERVVKHGVKNRDPVAVKSARLLRDGKTVFLEIDDLQRVMQMHVRYSLDDADGDLVEGDIYHTVNFLGRHSEPGDD